MLLPDHNMHIWYLDRKTQELPQLSSILLPSKSIPPAQSPSTSLWQYRSRAKGREQDDGYGKSLLLPSASSALRDKITCNLSEAVMLPVLGWWICFCSRAKKNSEPVFLAACVCSVVHKRHHLTATYTTILTCLINSTSIQISVETPVWLAIPRRGQIFSKS